MALLLHYFVRRIPPHRDPSLFVPRKREEGRFEKKGRFENLFSPLFPKKNVINVINVRALIWQGF